MIQRHALKCRKRGGLPTQGNRGRKSETPGGEKKRGRVFDLITSTYQSNPSSVGKERRVLRKREM